MFVDVVFIISVVPFWVLVAIIAAVVPELVASTRYSVEPTSSYSGADVISDMVDVQLSHVITVHRSHAVWTNRQTTHVATYSRYVTITVIFVIC